MTKKVAIAEMIKCQENDDPEIAHADADNVLCALLDTCGHHDVVVEYRKVERWFA